MIQSNSAVWWMLSATFRHHDYDHTHARLSIFYGYSSLLSVAWCTDLTIADVTGLTAVHCKAIWTACACCEEAVRLVL